MNRKQRHALAALATSATLSVAGVMATLTPAGGLVTGPIPPVTTTLPGDPVGTIGGLVPTTTTTTAPPTTTTTAPPTTTTTTVPVEDDDDEDDGTTGGTHTSSGGGDRPAIGPVAVPISGAAATSSLPSADLAGGLTGPVGAAVDAPIAIAPRVTGQPAALRSPVLVDHAAPLAYSVPLGGRSTRSVLDILFGMDVSPELLGRVVAPFPVAGPASYSNDWQAPRTTPEFHLHEGTDVFADTGTPVVASGDGIVTKGTGPVGGNALRVTETDGTYYYYAHLDSFVVGLDDGQRVQKGDIIGFVGDTGNAEGSAPHLHFEIHPKGGAAVPPVPYLDRWLIEATATASTLRGQPSATGSLVQLQPKSKGSAVRNALLSPASNQRPLPSGATLDPSVGLEISAGALLMLWFGRRFKRRLDARRA